MSRIKQVTDNAKLNNRKLLIPYLVSGDPNLASTLSLMHGLVKAGADIIELGIPFSDPSSDGAVIQRGVERALAKGTQLKDVMSLVRQFREKDESTPIVLMGYLNPIEYMGYESFAALAADSGVDGVLIVDMPPVESGELHGILKSAGIDTIYLVAPTTREARLQSICGLSSGYLYYVSLKGVTGAAISDYGEIEANISRLRAYTQQPIVVGFGIKDADSAKAMAAISDGVIIGSALVDKIALLADQDSQDNADIVRTTEIIGLARKAINDLI
ncbi:MAG: tryptophan synthase subunit alpha [Gammaproteobacteria bacterium]|jgi:tryptophan synthase alpha chain|nr:tryptophan synthase subunit alpha [Gammaproteobacteria bacterium]MBT3858740.1 tryptophan synthase subunit alpha [Gammaproteobacteria bacterium]MBT3986092.1 tryptophan synthase subunit alpha [Gammaproteobacteria bacterium]MBT4256574.1 tryptophan synthase subunit alpha [Gammaproteobacteria bacterium]MBT4580803.1 tryptophan synthase subunit alpha [Gammaproteobacteria bacterium]